MLAYGVAKVSGFLNLPCASAEAQIVDEILLRLGQASCQQGIARREAHLDSQVFVVPQVLTTQLLEGLKWDGCNLSGVSLQPSRGVQASNRNGDRKVARRKERTARQKGSRRRQEKSQHGGKQSQLLFIRSELGSPVLVSGRIARSFRCVALGRWLRTLCSSPTMTGPAGGFGPNVGLGASGRAVAVDKQVVGNKPGRC